MKGIKWYDKIVFLANSLAALLLLLSYILPYIPPQRSAFLSVLSLGVPLLIILNILFLLYWLLRVKKQLILSLLVLLIGYSYIGDMYRFSGSKSIEADHNFTIMNYNVRLFNLFNWLPEKTVKSDIQQFILKESPDIVCLQEYHKGDGFSLKDYFIYEKLVEGRVKSGQAILSKFPIVNSGSVEFPESSNNAIFIDFVKDKDTIRVYNLHLQSSGINTEVSVLKETSSENLIKRVSSTFKMQQKQADLFIKHKETTRYKTIVSGDFNNTAYSYVYKQIKADFNDTFTEAGNGFGRTYDFKFFPVRIDFILSDKAFTVNGFKSYDLKLSDHYPIMATLNLH
ncbi:MAG: endonuclease/exonuclease/phosphatase family protein [Bacteroidota bacterium]